MVYDLHQNKPVVRISSTDIHDGRSYGTRAYINDTGAQRVVKVTLREEGESGEIEGQGQIDVMENAAWTTGLGVVAQKAIFKVLRGVSKLFPGRAIPEYNCRPNWLRGLLVVDDDHVLVGMSPAAIALVNLEREEVVDFCQLSNRLCEAVFAIASGEPSGASGELSGNRLKNQRPETG
jgi:hypothetical protein